MQGGSRDRRAKERRFWRDSRGATAIEFAILSIPTIAVLCASLQTALIMFFGQALQTQTNNAARQILVGSVQSQNLSQSAFQTLVCNSPPKAFACANLYVDVQSAASFSALSTTPITLTYDSKGNVTNTWNYSTGGKGSAVILRVLYQWPVFGGPLGIGLANQSNGTHLLVGTSVFQTEPY